MPASKYHFLKAKRIVFFFFFFFFFFEKRLDFVVRSAGLGFELSFVRFAGELSFMFLCITKTCLYDFDPLKPHFYIIKLGFAGVHLIFRISAQKHKLWVLVRTASPSNEYPQSMF